MRVTWNAFSDLRGQMASETMGSMRQLVEKDFRSEDTPRLAKNLLGQVLALEIDGVLTIRDY